MRYILIALFLWSSSFVAGKYTYSMLDPVLMVQMRLIIASFIVCTSLEARSQNSSPTSVVAWVSQLSGYFPFTIHRIKPYIGV